MINSEVHSQNFDIRKPVDIFGDKQYEMKKNPTQPFGNPSFAQKNLDSKKPTVIITDVQEQNTEVNLSDSDSSFATMKEGTQKSPRMNPLQNQGTMVEVMRS